MLPEYAFDYSKAKPNRFTLDRKRALCKIKLPTNSQSEILSGGN